MDIKDLPGLPKLKWSDPPTLEARYLTTDIMPVSEFLAMHERIGGRNSLKPKTNFGPKPLEKLKENAVMKAIEDDFVFSSHTMEPDSILFLEEVIEMFKPQKILELGAGLSTLILSAKLKAMHANGKDTPAYVTIDQSQENLDKVKDLAKTAGVDSYFKAEVFDMCRYKVGDEFAIDEKALPCFDFTEKRLHDLLGGTKPDMIIIDGPMDEKSLAGVSFAKVLTLPILSLYAAPGCLFVMDGAYMDPEIFAMEQWQASGTAHIIGVKAVGKGMVIALKPA
jgi:hypothetical protein